MFFQTVTDHYYAAHLITLQASPGANISPGDSAVRDAFQFLKIQQITIAEVAHKWPCVCCHCGDVEVLRGIKHTPRMKVGTPPSLWPAAECTEAFDQFEMCG